MLYLVGVKQVYTFFGFELLLVLLTRCQKQLISAAFPLLERALEEMIGGAVSDCWAFYALIVDVDGISSATVLRAFNEFYCRSLSFVGSLLLNEGEFVAIPLSCRSYPPTALSN